GRRGPQLPPGPPAGAAVPQQPQSGRLLPDKCRGAALPLQRGSPAARDTGRAAAPAAAAGSPAADRFPADAVGRGGTYSTLYMSRRRAGSDSFARRGQRVCTGFACCKFRLFLQEYFAIIATEYTNSYKGGERLWICPCRLNTAWRSRWCASSLRRRLR